MVDCVTSGDNCVLDGVDPSQHALTRSGDRSHNLSIYFDEILSEQPPAAVATQPCDAQNQIITAAVTSLPAKHQSEFHFTEQGYLCSVGGE